MKRREECVQESSNEDRRHPDRCLSQGEREADEAKKWMQMERPHQAAGPIPVVVYWERFVSLGQVISCSSVWS